MRPAISLVASPYVADAQPSRGLPKVGYADMNEPGHVPGQSIVGDLRGYSTNDQLRQTLNESVRLSVDVIFVGAADRSHPDRVDLYRRAAGLVTAS